MRRVMWRTDDEDLYQRVFEAAHDNRVSMNAWITNTLRDAVTEDGSEVPADVISAWENEAEQDKANARASLTHATESRDA